MPIEEHTLECDVLVAGGGPAGVPCAIAAARGGAKVILCQDRPVLGGNASSEVRMHIVGADHSGTRGEALKVEAREGGIIEEIRLETAVRNPQRSASMLDLVLYELCRAEPNLTLMLNTAVTGAAVEGDCITHVTADRASTEDRFTIAAKVFVDCTGDGRLGAEAGAPFVHGREAASTYNESLAHHEADGKTLGSTLLFCARKHNEPMPFTPPPWVRTFSEDDLRLRPHASPRVDYGWEYGYWWVEWGGEHDTIKDNEMIRDELLAIMLGVWDHVKNGPRDDPAYPNTDSHGAANWALDWFGFLPGKRESRRFVGQYTLTEHDVMGSTPFADAIAFGGWPIDTHPPGGVDSPDEPPCDQTAVPRLFDIPLRACVSRDVSNLMFAGRNISASHIAFASTRVMATCAVVGQGVGTSAAAAVARSVAPSVLADDAGAMHAIQQQLVRDDAYLVGVPSDGEGDLARTAVITASSEQADGAAANVVTGQTRAVHGDKGAPPDRALPGTHRWMSDPAAGLPASLELRWDQPIAPWQVQVVFDTGMHRVLTLSHSDYYTMKMQWGEPQVETVRDYRISVEKGGKWVDVATVEGNYQRRRMHAIEAGTVSALRIEVTATNGLDHARICGVSVWA